MRILLTLACLALTLLVWSPPNLSADIPRLDTIYQNSTQFDGKEVSIIGTIRAYKEKVNKDREILGCHFWLEQGNKMVFVHANGFKDYGEKMRVVVTGTFYKLKEVPDYTLDNAIDAKRIEELK
ncbi:MAG: hypothetical protein HYU64_14305 [Armatimonadetes bacterium]|nr:hypothetical protein [Armatimonadota bacterium]